MEVELGNVLGLPTSANRVRRILKVLSVTVAASAYWSIATMIAWT